jgi:hypothetical protein
VEQIAPAAAEYRDGVDGALARSEHAKTFTACLRTAAIGAQGCTSSSTACPWRE